MAKDEKRETLQVYNGVPHGQGCEVKAEEEVYAGSYRLGQRSGPGMESRHSARLM